MSNTLYMFVLQHRRQVETSDRSISKDGLWLYLIVRDINFGVNTILPRICNLLHQQQVMQLKSFMVYNNNKMYLYSARISTIALRRFTYMYT